MTAGDTHGKEASLLTHSLTRSPLLSMCVCARVVLCVVPPVNQPLLHHLLLDTE
jgi:hypothetical protein